MDTAPYLYHDPSPASHPILERPVQWRLRECPRAPQAPGVGGHIWLSLMQSIKNLHWTE